MESALATNITCTILSLWRCCGRQLSAMAASQQVKKAGYWFQLTGIEFHNAEVHGPLYSCSPPLKTPGPLSCVDTFR